LFKYSFAVEIKHNDKKLNTPENKHDWKYISTHNVNNPSSGIPVSHAPTSDDPSRNELLKILCNKLKSALYALKKSDQN